MQKRRFVVFRGCMQTDRAEPKAPWWCSLWMVVATLTVLAIANVALWTTSNAAAEDRSKSLTAKAVGTMKRQVSARLEDINRLNLRANDAITNSGAMGTPSVTDGTTDTTKTIADFILESNVFDEQTGVLAIINATESGGRSRDRRRFRTSRRRSEFDEHNALTRPRARCADSQPRFTTADHLPAPEP